ncbi:MAG: thioesterase family protein [Planctomycetota bacterium]|jgi:acyl-CoA thioester hydrolase|nr:thioesterase family protein [Planctomycetota bacterium]
MSVYQDSEYRLLYRDVDQMGVLYYARYLELFELGRTEWVRAQGFSYRDMEEKLGLMLPVTYASCKYHSSLYFDDVALIRTTIAAWSSTTVRYNYEVFEKSEMRLCATGEVELGCLTKDSHSPAPLPKSLIEVFQGAVPEKKGRIRN